MFFCTAAPSAGPSLEGLEARPPGDDDAGAVVLQFLSEHGDVLVVVSVDTTATTGLVTNNSTNVTYDPNGQFDDLAVGQSTTDTFSYTISDGNGGTDTAAVTVTILPAASRRYANESHPVFPQCSARR